MKLFQWLFSLLRKRKKIYHVHIPVGMQLSQQVKEALFGGLLHSSQEAHHESE